MFECKKGRNISPCAQWKRKKVVISLQLISCIGVLIIYSLEQRLFFYPSFQPLYLLWCLSHHSVSKWIPVIFVVVLLFIILTIWLHLLTLCKEDVPLPSFAKSSFLFFLRLVVKILSSRLYASQHSTDNVWIQFPF